ncbi:cytochrome c oxidase assembly factor Coa1 family protein [Hyalangium rubrum]|uniref:Cytochrome c oxidase assembly factor Coa1 family protein n=1 Tax=Hyalangium rubrum TaxID=3103134 RepID=A0ABU5GZ31_9BACT|nr:cytochrome c oxidase assembly factor Coa1 family protein [Hyalangium sp. s54d21]MDY7226444.1 cytochrome c oxidase assembly factor Coa1 family protein [Hyalangium sp. s54d21]
MNPSKPSGDFARRTLVLLGVGVVVGVTLLVGAGTWAIYGWILDSAPSQAAQAFLREHPDIQADLGEGIWMDGMLQGEFSEKAATGSATFRLPLRGSQGEGWAEVRLTKAGGQWRVTSADYEGRDGVRRKLAVPEEEEGTAGKAPAAAPKEEAEDADRKQLVHAHGLYKEGRGRDAVTVLNGLLERSPDNAEALYWRAQIRTKLGENEAAREDILRAVALNVDLREAYQLHDFLLARERRWEEIIHAWTQYLERHPEDDVALLERAGTWHHHGDDVRAVEDLKRSCELGNGSACRLHKRQTGQ